MISSLMYRFYLHDLPRFKGLLSTRKAIAVEIRLRIWDKPALSTI